MHDGFLCTISTLLHKFLLEKGVCDIIQYRPRIGTSLPNSNYQERDEEWEGFLNAKWKYTRQQSIVVVVSSTIIVGLVGGFYVVDCSYIGLILCIEIKFLFFVIRCFVDVTPLIVFQVMWTILYIMIIQTLTYENIFELVIYVHMLLLVVDHWGYTFPSYVLLHSMKCTKVHFSLWKDSLSFVVSALFFLQVFQSTKKTTSHRHSTQCVVLFVMHLHRWLFHTSIVENGSIAVNQLHSNEITRFGWLLSEFGSRDLWIFYHSLVLTRLVTVLFLLTFVQPSV